MRPLGVICTAGFMVLLLSACVHTAGGKGLGPLNEECGITIPTDPDKKACGKADPHAPDVEIWVGDDASIDPKDEVLYMEHPSQKFTWKLKNPEGKKLCIVFDDPSAFKIDPVSDSEVTVKRKGGSKRSCQANKYTILVQHSTGTEENDPILIIRE